MSQIMKNINRLAILGLILLCSGFVQELQATHIVGADMTFSCTAKDWYEIHLTVRRDCFNGDPEAVFDDPGYVGIYDAFGTPLNWLGSLGLVRMELVSVENIDPDVLGCAPDGTEICVSEARYVGKVFLPFREKGYILGYQRCCRNVTLSNIVNPLETGNTSFVCITEESLSTCNISPEFGNWPSITICAGVPLAFDASATDAEGDSLAYKLYTPHAGASLATPQPIPPEGPPYDEVEYAPGFSLENMLGSGTPLTIDETTGLLTATPGAVGQYLVGILVEEWRDGKEISKTRRNFEYNVIICDPEKLLSFEAPDVQCEGLTVNFVNTTFNQDRTFNWNFNYPNDDPAFMSNEVSPSFTYPERGTYLVQMTATGGPETCNTQVIKEVRVADSHLSASFEVNQPMCIGDQLTLRFNSTSEEPDPEESIVLSRFDIQAGNNTFSVEGSNPEITVPCASSISITHTVESSNTCTATTTQNFDSIPVNPPVSVEFFGDTLYVCPGEEIRLISNPNPEWTYTWTPETGLDLTDPSNPLASPEESTTYFVEVTNGDMIDSGSVRVERIDDILDIAIINNSGECADVADLTAVANNAMGFAVVYEWSLDQNFSSVVATGADVQIPIEGESATFYLRAGGERFCGSNVPNVTVERFAQGISAQFEPINTCVSPDGMVSVVTSNPDNPITVIWEPSDNITSGLNSQTVNITALEGQTEISLTYTAFDSEGCMKIDTIIVPVVDELIVMISGGPSVCNESSVYFASANVSNEFVSYEWSLDEGFADIISTDSIVMTDAPAGNTLYLRGRTELCESNVASIIIEESTGILDVDAPRRICVGDTADVELLIPAGDNLVVTWDPAQEIISGLNEPVVIIVGLATTSPSVILSYTATDGDSCILTGSIEIPYSTVIPPAPDPQIQCGTHGVSFVIDPIYEDGDVFWDFGTIAGETVTSTEANPLIDFGMPGIYSASLSSTMETCNFDPLSITFEVPEILEITTADTLLRLCVGDSLITLGAESNASLIVWTDQDDNLLTTGDSITVDIREISSVTATVSDAFGCSESITFDLAPYMFDITIDGPSEFVCGADPITITATDNTGANLSYMWISASGVVSGEDAASPTIDPLNAEDLVLVATHVDLNCVTEIPFPITGGPNPTASISTNPGTNIVLGQTVDLNVSTDAAGPTYSWSNGSTTSSISVIPDETTTYRVTVTDENGCTAEAEVTITVEIVCDESSLFIPDAFSPNNDNVNDLLFVRLNGAASVDFQILDRWGKEVFRTMDQSEGWNGRHRQNGDELSPDVYAYCVKVTCPDGSEIVKAGNVSLIR